MKHDGYRILARMEADTLDALALQRPLPNDALLIVAKGEKEDGVVGSLISVAT